MPFDARGFYISTELAERREDELREEHVSTFDHAALDVEEIRATYSLPSRRAWTDDMRVEACIEEFGFSKAVRALAPVSAKAKSLAVRYLPRKRDAHG